MVAEFTKYVRKSASHRVRCRDHLLVAEKLAFWLILGGFWLRKAAFSDILRRAAKKEARGGSGTAFWRAPGQKPGSDCIARRDVRGSCALQIADFWPGSHTLGSPASRGRRIKVLRTVRRALVSLGPWFHAAWPSDPPCRPAACTRSLHPVACILYPTCYIP